MVIFMKNILIIGLVSMLALLVSCAPLAKQEAPVVITSFEQCVAAGNPVMESYPRQCNANGKNFVEEIQAVEPQPAEVLLTEEQARDVALSSECLLKGKLGVETFYNENSKTWWFELIPNEENKGCNPACVVDAVTSKAEINWRCTGLLPE